MHWPLGDSETRAGETSFTTDNYRRDKVNAQQSEAFPDFVQTLIRGQGLHSCDGLPEESVFAIGIPALMNAVLRETREIFGVN